MRFLTLTPYPPIVGGGSVHAQELSQRLATHGHHVCVMSFKLPTDGDDATADYRLEDGVHVHRIPNFAFAPHDYTAKLYQQNVRLLEGVLRLVASAEPHFDLLVLHGYFMAPTALVISAALGLPMVYHVHSVFPLTIPTDSPDRTFFTDLETRTIRGATYVVPVSDYVAEMCATMGGDPAKLHVIPKAIDLHDYERRWEPLDSETVLYVGRLSPEKGLETLFEAVALLKARGVRLRLLVAGAGEPQYVTTIQQRVSALGLHDTVAFLGNMEGHRLTQLYQRASVTVVPSYVEAFGRVAIEAMAAGCPVVVTSVGGLGPLVEDGVTGWVVPPREPQALAQALQDALSNDARAKRQVIAARAEVERKFTWDRILPETLAVYEACVGA